MGLYTVIYTVACSNSYSPKDCKMNEVLFRQGIIVKLVQYIYSGMNYFLVCGGNISWSKLTKSQTELCSCHLSPVKHAHTYLYKLGSHYYPHRFQHDKQVPNTDLLYSNSSTYTALSCMKLQRHTHLFGKSTGFIVRPRFLNAGTKLGALSIQLPGRISEDPPVAGPGILKGTHTHIHNHVQQALVNSSAGWQLI